MGLIFIPTDDFNRDALQADAITDAELGSVTIGTTASISFRIGNTGIAAVTWSLSVPDDPDNWQLPEGGNLASGETTDTLTVNLNVPLDAQEMGVVVDLIATDGTTDYPLQINYEAMGSNATRRANYPRRAGDITESSSGVLDSLGDRLKLYIYDPIAWNPDAVTGYGQQVKAEPLGTATDTLAGYRPLRVINGNDPCTKLNPLDSTYGYTQTVAIMQGQFSNEARETRSVNLTSNDTMMEYQVGASLVFGGEYEMVRFWALFAEATELEQAQYKRSVFTIFRLGEWWSIENIRTLDFGTTLSHFEADLIAIHSRMLGNRTFWSPFAQTFAFESDIPYAQFVCPLEFPTEEYEDSSGGSNAAS